MIAELDTWCACCGEQEGTLRSNGDYLCDECWLNLSNPSQLGFEARLGRLVLAMPIGGTLRRTDTAWVGTFTAKGGWARHTEATPEAAIRAILEAAR
jgi:hypothetical protein